MSTRVEPRNIAMIEQIEATPVRYPFRFVIAGDSGPWPDAAGDAIFTGMLGQMRRLDPLPLFFVNLGDFAGPGTRARHEHYLRLVDPLPLPNLCVIGNHDLDDPSGWENFERVHGPVNFRFTYGHTLFVAINCQMGTDGPREEDLAYLGACLQADERPNRILLMHMPPHFEGRYEPNPEWGFAAREAEFMALVRRHGVKLVCCAHVLAYDQHVWDSVRYVVSGGGGSLLWSHLEGVCLRDMEAPPHWGIFNHFVEITVEESGEISGRVIRAFEGTRDNPAYRFREVTGPE